MSSVTRDLLQRIIEPVVVAEGLDLEELDLSRAGRRHRLRIVVDADGGVDLDNCAEVSRSISTVLDDSDAMGAEPYTLEVSSPGVSRPLTLPRHWARAAGRLVRITTTEGDVFTGRIVSAGDDVAAVDVEGAVRDVVYDQVRRAKIQVEFRRTDDDGTEVPS